MEDSTSSHSKSSPLGLVKTTVTGRKQPHNIEVTSYDQMDMVEGISWTQISTPHEINNFPRSLCDVKEELSMLWRASTSSCPNNLPLPLDVVRTTSTNEKRLLEKFGSGNNHSASG